MTTTSPLSVIIPLGPQEKEWQQLCQDIEAIADPLEILWVYADGPYPQAIDLPGKNSRWIQSSPGRAQQLNMGAEKASHEFLWFLHADSRFDSDGIKALYASINDHSDALHYFDLRFSESIPLMKLNERGVWFRSHYLGVPFGDQGFCIRKALFKQIGGYSETVAYGEDHLFLWQARQQGIRLRCTGAPLITSPRKYQANGWLRTTLSHQYLWLKQAIPEFIRLYFN